MVSVVGLQSIPCWQQSQPIWSQPQARPALPIWFYVAASLAKAKGPSKSAAVAAKPVAGRISEGGWGPSAGLTVTGGSANNFLHNFYYFYCPIPTHLLAFQYMSVWMRHSGAHPAAGGRYRGGAPPACHHNTCVRNQRQLKCCHDLLLIPVRAAARSGDRSAS